MENLQILNKKEGEKILNLIKDRYGIKKLDFDYGILKNKKGKIFLITKDINKIDLFKLRINELGLYVARLDKGIRLTIEGSQLFGKYATKNIYEVDKEIANSWMQGEDISSSKVFNDFVIIKYKNDYLGGGKCINQKILNFIPKERRIKQKET